MAAIDDATSTTMRAGDDTADAPLIEPSERKGTRLQITDDDRRDQISRDDKEDVDADEAATEVCEIEMEEYQLLSI